MHCKHSPVCKRAMTTNHCVGQGIFKCGGTSLETLVTNDTCNVGFLGVRTSSSKAQFQSTVFF